MFSLIVDTALLEMSMNTADLAPRLKASMAKAPVPAKRSSTQAFSTSKVRILNIDSRIRSEVGLVFVPLIDRIFLPFKFPLITLKRLSLMNPYYLSNRRSFFTKPFSVNALCFVDCQRFVWGIEERL